MPEENAAYCRANNEMDDEMEDSVAKLRAEWKSDASGPLFCSHNRRLA